MNRQHMPRVFWVGLLVYALSFFLPMSVGRGSVAGCAFDWFFFPLIYVHWHSMATFLADAPIENVSIAVSGWINPFFLIATIFLVMGKTPKLTKVLRYVFLLTLPFCWIVFVERHTYPREGYFLWTSGMLLVMFSSELESRRFNSPVRPNAICSVQQDNPR